MDNLEHSLSFDPSSREELHLFPSWTEEGPNTGEILKGELKVRDMKAPWSGTNPYLTLCIFLGARQECLKQPDSMPSWQYGFLAHFADHKGD